MQYMGEVMHCKRLYTRYKCVLEQQVGIKLSLRTKEEPAPDFSIWCN